MQESLMKKFIPLVVVPLALAASTVAFGAEDPVLNVYNWSDYIAEDTIEKFEDKTGIKVTYDVFDSNEVLEAKLLAGSTGYDVVVPTSDFLQRQIAAGVYQPLNKALLPNLANMDPNLMAAAATYDKGNEHAVIYMWGTTGIGYNVNKVKEVLGKDAPVDSLDLVFDPENAKKLSKCGLTFLDAPTEIIPSALKYLGLDPNSTKPKDVAKAAEVLRAIQPYVRYFHSSQYINDLAAGEVCVSMGWSGDVFQAQASAEEAGNGVEINYSIPKQGALQWFDMMAIPVDAPHPENAHKFINFIMDAQVTADITNYVWYANGNAASLPLVDEEVTSNTSIFPSDAVKAQLFTSVVHTAKESRLFNKTWSKVKAGN